MMLIHCNTPIAIILIPLRAESGTWIFPSHPGPWAGLQMDVVPLQPVIPQIQTLIKQCIGLELQNCGYDVSPEFQELVELPSGPATLYVVQPSSLDKKLIAINELAINYQPDQRSSATGIRFATLPEWLTLMPAKRQRLAWLRAWQIYQGLLEDQVKAVELDEFVDKAID